LLAFFGLTLFVSATLLFFVQPMIGKMILPRLGGTPAVWNTCMVFFQAMLLVGYAYTHTLSTTQSRRRQLLVQAVLLFLPVAVLPFALGERTPPAEENPIFWLFWLLLGVVGLPFFVVATTAPLLQKWFATTGHSAARDPYFLYGASNLGSMIGLLMYPALIEWLWDVPTQAIVWTVGYGLFIALVLGCALLVWRAPEPALAVVEPPPPEPAPLPPPAAVPEPAAPVTAVTASRRRGVRLQHPAAAPAATKTPAVALQPPAPSFLNRLAWNLLAKAPSNLRPGADDITFGRRLRWVLLAAAPSSLMLGVTTYMTTDIAAVPFFWVVPLALYLLTFILVFARWPVVWIGLPHTLMLYFQPCFLLFLVLRMVGHLAVPLWLDFLLHIAAFFTTTLLCHGELAKDRPSAKHLTEFYLWMSVGGVLGGMFNALVAPLAFSYGIIEYPLAMVVACLMRPYMAQDVSQAHEFALPRKVQDAFAQGFDAVLFTLGMTTYNAPALRSSADGNRPGAVGSALQSLRRCFPQSSLLELLFDLLVPIAFAVFAYFMVDLGQRQVRLFQGTSLEPVGFTLRRSYAMAAVVVLVLAMAMRPVRFGLSLALLFAVVTVYDRSYDSFVYEDRGFFGLVRVREITDTVKDASGEEREVPVRRTLIHGGIDHGQQILWPPAKRREPVTYFHPTNGIGEIFHKLTWGNPPGKVGLQEHKAWMTEQMWLDAPEKRGGETTADWEKRHDEWYREFSRKRMPFYPGDARLPAALVGLGTASPWAQLAATQAQPPYAVVGLGAGTLAAHAQPLQHVDFYEIDPIIKHLSVPPSGKAEDLIFYYVNDAANRGANISIIMGDGRLKMKEGPDRYYHAILLDAFSSDAVPVHLLTKEAVELYLDKLAEGGILIFNTTNRYVALQPFLAKIAEELKLECLTCPDHYSEQFPGKFGADWVALRRRDGPGGYRNGGPSLFDRLQVSEQRWQRVEPYPGKAWTDAYSNLLSAMRW
jgi:SAM-dependent methyltransferase